jgi:hypothetical protein
MSDRGKTTSQLPVWANGVSGNDSLVLLTRSQPIPNTYIVNLSVTFSNANFSISLSPSQFLSTNNLIVSNNSTPANSISTVIKQGSIWSDGTYFYYATSNNHVKRMGSLADF